MPHAERSFSRMYVPEGSYLLVGTSPYKSGRTCQIAASTFMVVELRFGDSWTGLLGASGTEQLERKVPEDLLFHMRCKTVKESAYF